MITLCMDTSHIYLSLALIRDDEIIGQVQEECWKHQSEEIFPKLEEMLSKLSLKSDDINQIVITKGPGSYTGVRIAMTIAKVFCSMTNKPLYTLPTMLLYAGLDDCRVVLDARGKRIYTCAYKNGKKELNISLILKMWYVMKRSLVMVNYLEKKHITQTWQRTSCC